MSEPEFQHELDDELLSAYLDGELTVDERAAVEARLASDPAARQLLHQLRSVSQSVQALPLEPVGRDLREQILRRAEALKPATGTSDVIPKVTIFQTRRSWIWASLAVAAGLMIMALQRGDEQGKNLPAVAQHKGTAAATRELEGSIRRELNEPAPKAVDAAKIALSEPATPAVTMPAASPSAAAAPRPVELGVAVGETLAAPGGESPESGEQQESLVVVHVVANSAAIKNQAFDKLLASNGIDVEAERLSEKTERAGGTANRLAKETDADHLADKSALQPADGEAEVDVVLVDAPKPAIVSCLAGLKQDEVNFVGVEVDQPTASVDRSDAKSPVENKLGFDLGQYGRGVVSQQQKDSFRGRYNYRGAAEMERAKLDRGLVRNLNAVEDRKQQLSEPEQLRRQVRAAEGRGQARRITLSETNGVVESKAAARGAAGGPLAGESRAMRQAPSDQLAPAGGAGDNVQVLFVISPDRDAATGAPTKKAAK